MFENNYEFWTPKHGRVFNNEYAFDAETELIDEELPDRIPRFVIAGVCDGEHAYLLTRDNLAEFFRQHPDKTIVMHNAKFDLAVINQEIAGEFDIYSLVDRGHVRDTMILNRLLHLGTNGNSSIHGSSLADCCQTYLSLKLSKDDTDDSGQTVRTNFGQWIDDPKALPEEYIAYLLGDINMTYQLYRRLQNIYIKLWNQILQDRPFGFVDKQHLKEAWTKYGPLTHHIQLMASIVLDAVMRNGLKVDTGRLNEFRQSLLDEQKKILGELLNHGYKPGKGSDSTLQRILRQIEADTDIRFPRTETGKISTARETLEPYEQGIPFIGLYLRSRSIEKLLSSFLEKMRKGTLHPTFDYLKNTGRTSAFGDISSQNLPRDERIRNLFIPSDGHVFVDADYSAIEMASLAQGVLSQLGGKSAMADAINAGADLHRLVAAKMADKPESEVDKFERQKAKAVNFGLPGGMGIATLREYARQNYGVELSERETQALRDTWFRTFPEMEKFLNSSKRENGNLGETLFDLLRLNESAYCGATGKRLYGDSPRSILGWMARKVFMENNPCTKKGIPYTREEIEYFWTRVDEIALRLSTKLQQDVASRKPSPELVAAICRLTKNEYVLTATGRLRANVTFCSQHNTIFQGLAADGAKLAMWKLWRAGYRIVNFIHDEFLVEVPESSDYTEVAESIKRLMIEGMQEVTPDIKIGVEYAVTRRWSKGAEVKYDDKGRLIVSD